MTDVTHYHESSLVRDSGPWAMGIRCARGALCPDGVRRTAYPTYDGIADTFYSVPCRVRVTRDGARFTVGGYVTVETMDGYSSHSDEDPLTVKFLPYLYGRNGHVLASDESLGGYVRTAHAYERSRSEMFAREDPSSRYLDPYRQTAADRYPYVDRAMVEMTRRGLVLVDLDRGKHGQVIFRTMGPSAGQILKTKHGGYA